MVDFNEVERAFYAVKECRATQGDFDRYVAANPQGARILDVWLSADSPVWEAIKSILQVKLSRELEEAERALQRACSSGASSHEEEPISAL